MRFFRWLCSFFAVFPAYLRNGRAGGPFLHIQPTSAEDYNARRTHPSPGWFAIAKYNHTRRWRILLEKLNLPIYNNRDVLDITPQLKVRVISDYNFEDENLSD